MKSSIVTGPGTTAVVEVDKPLTGPRDVLVRIRACGICGSDALYIAIGGLPPRAGHMPLGHEPAGEVVEVGGEVAGIRVGDRVVINPMAAPDGIIGNDDCGQMSAWLVLSTLGFYPVVPASGTYVAGVPLVRRAELTRPDGTRLEIRPGQRPGVWLDDRPVDATAVPHAWLMTARRLEVGTPQ